MARGDHIYVRRWLGYTHHGIELDDGTVVHRAGEPLRSQDVEVRVDTMERFARGGRVRHRCARLDDSADKALSRVGERGYNLFTRNCEHFATSCAYGEKRSNQVRAAAVVSLGLIGVAAVQAVRLRAERAEDAA